ncbi:hypothetical protein AK812_SmicGene18772 [Symbiodinium microadriaticum]|uniref:Uncharacterized protein n=1 Tax=Symbiodinium microadriaticum TaxID=2951 RepID=A0A1Q9DU78_SYMMI|nr:hypothetical protein AK812_SmicGene18772 [Symbiodinium microadriaticum]
MVSVAATTLTETMDAAVPTTPPSDSSSFDYSDDGRHDAAEQVLTNATLLKTILKFHTELRVRMVAVSVEDTPIARHANQAVQSAMDALVQQHPQAHHTTVIRDYRPQHTLIEKLVSPDIVYSLLLMNIQAWFTEVSRAARFENVSKVLAVCMDNLEEPAELLATRLLFLPSLATGEYTESERIMTASRRQVNGRYDATEMVTVQSRKMEGSRSPAQGAAQLPQLRAQDLANRRWGLATSALRDVPLPTAASSVGLLKIQDFTPQGASNTVQSPTTAMALDKRALQLDLERNAMAVRGLGHLDERKAQELSNTAWALTTAHSEQEPPIDAASSMALDRLGEFSPRHSANLAWCPGVTSRAIGLSSLHATASHLFRSKVDEGAIWTLSQLDDVTAAFQLVDSAAWKIPPLSLSPLLSRCEQEGPSSKELRVLSFLAHDELKPLTEEVVASRLRVAREAQRPDAVQLGISQQVLDPFARRRAKSQKQPFQRPGDPEFLECRARTLTSHTRHAVLRTFPRGQVKKDACPIDLPDEMPALEAKKTRFQRPSECRVDELVFICEMQILSTGDRVSCIEMTMDGWLKIADDRGWMISDMQGLHGIGEVLSPKRGEDVKLAVEVSAAWKLFTHSADDRGFDDEHDDDDGGDDGDGEDEVCGGNDDDDDDDDDGDYVEDEADDHVAVRASPSRDAVALYYRRKGELVFARSQNFGGWLRLAGVSLSEEGWMLAHAPEHGTLLRVREALTKRASAMMVATVVLMVVIMTMLMAVMVTANADLWSLSDLWAAVRMLSPTDVRSLKDAEEGTLLMADMDYEHHVKTGNAECLVEDGLLLKAAMKALLSVQHMSEEDLKKPDDWIRQRLFAASSDAYSLLRMAKEEPPLNELCPGDFKLTPRPPPMDLFKKITLEEENFSSAKFGNGSSGGYGFGHGGHSNGRGTANNSGPGFFKQHDFSLGGHRDKGPPNRGEPSSYGGKGRNGKGMKGMGKGFGGMMDGMGGVPGLDGSAAADRGERVMSVDINGREYLMTQVVEITEVPRGLVEKRGSDDAGWSQTGAHQWTAQEMLAGLSQMAMVELNGRPYLFVGGFLVDPQTQAVAFQVEQDGTVVDALTGEPCGMLEMRGAQASLRFGAAGKFCTGEVVIPTRCEDRVRSVQGDSCCVVCKHAGLQYTRNWKEPAKRLMLGSPLYE